MVILRSVIAILWVIFCAILLIAFVLWSLKWKIPGVIIYSLFLAISYGGFVFFFKKASVEKNNWPYGYIKFICVFSSICSIAIFMTFLYFTMGDIGFLPLKFMNLINNEDNFYSVFMQATYAFSGGGVSFILWCWVVAKHSKGKWPYTVAKLQLILVFFSTYSFAFVGDYMRFIH